MAFAINRALKMVSIALLICVILGALASCGNLDSLRRGSEGSQALSDADETESGKMQDSSAAGETESEEKQTTAAGEWGSGTKMEPEEQNRLAGTSISLEYNGDCRISPKGPGGGTLKGVTRILYRHEKARAYVEVTRPSSYGVAIDGADGNELTHVIIVFEKGHKIADYEKNILQECGIDYVFVK